MFTPQCPKKDRVESFPDVRCVETQRAEEAHPVLWWTRGLLWLGRVSTRAHAGESWEAALGGQLASDPGRRRPHPEMSLRKEEAALGPPSAQQSS